jgi:hypothetical protein
VLLNEKDQQSLMVVGAQKSGKTQFALELLNNYEKKAIAIIPDLNEKKFNNFSLVTIDQVHNSPHRAKIVFDRTNKYFLKIIYNKFLNGCIITDDTKFILRPWNYYDFEDIIGRRRQSNNDTICMYHGFGRIPDFAWDYHSHLVLFKTLNPEAANSKINIARALYVNKLAETNRYVKRIYQLN